MGARIHREATQSTRNPNDYLDGVFLGANLARVAAVTSGARVDLTAATSRRLTVLDVVGTNDASLNDGYFAVVLLPIAQDLFGRPHRVDAIYVVATPGADIAALETRIAPVVASEGQLSSPALEVSRAAGAIGSLQTLLDTLGGLAVVASVLLTFELLTLLGLLRRPELAVGRLIGRSRAAIVRGFLAEVAVVSGAGAALGALVGLAVSPAVVARVPAAYASALGSRIAYQPPLTGALLAILVATVGALSAATVAARAAGRIEPLEAVEASDGGAGDDGRGTAPWVVTGGLILLALGLGLLVGIGPARIPPGTVTALLLAGLAVTTWGGRVAVSRGLAGPLRLLGVAGRLAATGILSSPRRTWGLTMMVATATAVAVGVGGVGNGALTAVAGTVREHRQVDLVAQAAPSDGLPTALTMPASWQVTMAAMPGVRSVAPTRLRFADDGGGRFLVLGVGADSHDPAFRQADAPTQAAIAGSRGAVVTQGFADTHHVQRGALIQLGGEPRVPLRVLAVVQFPSVSPGGELVISNAVFQRAFGAAGPSRYELLLGPAATAAVRDRILALATADHVPTTVVTGNELADAEAGLVAPVVVLFLVMTWIVGLGTAVGLAASLVLSTTLRRREIAMLRVIGATRRQVGAMLAMEALAATSLGLLLGAIMGIGVFIAAAADAERFFGIPLRASLPAGVVLLVVIVGLGTSAAVAAGAGVLGAAVEPARSLAAD